jgi:hypothetical protein
MWLYLLGGALIVVGLVGGVFSAGVFAFVLIPLGIIAIASAAGYSAMGRAAQRRSGADVNAHPSTTRPLPHTSPGEPAHTPTSPEALADARRMEQ